MHRLHKASPFIALGAALLAWMLLPPAVKRLVRDCSFEMQAPLEAAASRVRDLQDYWALRTRSNQDLVTAGVELSRAVADLEQRAGEAETLRAEVARLERLLNMPPRPGWRREVARVSRRDFNAWWQHIIIRKGSSHGITVDAPVIFAGGVVGRVREVHAWSSVVELLSSPGFRIAVTVEGDDRPFSYQGGHNPAFGKPGGLAEYVPPDISVAAGRTPRLVTSGIGGIFPPGLQVGGLVRLEQSGDGLFQNGVVALDPGLAAITEVVVLLPPAQAGAAAP